MLCDFFCLVGSNTLTTLTARFHERVEEAMNMIALVSELALWARRKRDLKRTHSDYLRHQHTMDEEEDSHHDQDDDDDDKTTLQTDSRNVVEEDKTGSDRREEESNKGSGTAHDVKASNAHESVTRPSSGGSTTIRSFEEIDYNELLEPWTDPPRKGSGVRSHCQSA